MSKKLTDFFISNKEKPTLVKECSVSAAPNISISDGNIGIETPYHPPNAFSFPKTTFGKKDRSCQASWFVQFP